MAYATENVSLTHLKVCFNTLNATPIEPEPNLLELLWSELQKHIYYSGNIGLWAKLKFTRIETWYLALVRRMFN